MTYTVVRANKPEVGHIVFGFSPEKGFLIGAENGVAFEWLPIEQAQLGRVFFDANELNWAQDAFLSGKKDHEH